MKYKKNRCATTAHLIYIKECKMKPGNCYEANYNVFMYGDWENYNLNQIGMGCEVQYIKIVTEVNL